MLTYRRMFGSV